MANLSLNQIVITGTNPAVIHTLKKKHPDYHYFDVSVILSHPIRVINRVLDLYPDLVIYNVQGKALLDHCRRLGLVIFHSQITSNTIHCQDDEHFIIVQGPSQGVKVSVDDVDQIIQFGALAQ